MPHAGDGSPDIGWVVRRLQEGGVEGLPDQVRPAAVVLPEPWLDRDLPVVLFFLRLPFDLVFPEQTPLAFGQREGQGGSVRVLLDVARIAIELEQSALRPYDRGFEVLVDGVQPNLSSGASRQTWVVAQTGAWLTEEECAQAVASPWGSPVTYLFERVLRCVNDLIRADGAVSSNPWSHLLHKESLDGEVRFIASDQDSDDELRLSLRLHHRPQNARLEWKGPSTAASDIAQAMGLQRRASALQVPHPLAVGRELARRAHGLRLRGDALSALLSLNSSAEVLLRGLVLLARLDARSDVYDEAPRPLRGLLRVELPALLGGDWTSEQSPVRAFEQALYQPRNALVHGGREPSWTQIGKAFDAYESLLLFLEGRLHAQWRRHPRALAAWHDRRAGATTDPPRGAREQVRRMLEQSVPYWHPAGLEGAALDEEVWLVEDLRA